MNINIQQASLALQDALLLHLQQSLVLTDVVDARIYTMLPHPKALLYPYIFIESEEIENWSYSNHTGSVHTVSFLIATRNEGYNKGRVIADLLLTGLDNLQTSLQNWHIVLWRQRNQTMQRLKDGITLNLYLNISFFLEQN